MPALTGGHFSFPAPGKNLYRLNLYDIFTAALPESSAFLHALA
jgi:hypothetical protein